MTNVRIEVVKHGEYYFDVDVTSEDGINYTFDCNKKNLDKVSEQEVLEIIREWDPQAFALILDSHHSGSEVRLNGWLVDAVVIDAAKA